LSTIRVTQYKYELQNKCLTELKIVKEIRKYEAPH